MGGFLGLLRLPGLTCKPVTTLGPEPVPGFFVGINLTTIMDHATAHPDQLVIFDTTLRDGEQSPGASMNLSEKLEIAHVLAELGVDVIEAGFPIASNGDFEAVQAIAQQIEGPTICGLARCNPEDIDRAWEALKDQQRPRIHVFLATSAIHREFKLHMAKDEILRRAVAGVEQARRYCEDIEFSPEDASRTELDFLAEVVAKAIGAGASTINIPDTVGYAVPSQYAAAVRHLKNNAPGIDKIVLSVHCHNDLGLAVANSLAAVAEGARQVECTINGLGERAGNCALEEIVMAISTRADYYRVRTGINTRRLYPTSRLVSRVTGIAVQRNKAIVGQNAFAHEAGIHQDGMLKERRTCDPRTSASSGRSWSWVSTAAGTPCASAFASWVITWKRRRCSASSRPSRAWPTARRKSTTPTSRPWPRPRSTKARPCGRWKR